MSQPQPQTNSNTIKPIAVGMGGNPLSPQSQQLPAPPAQPQQPQQKVQQFVPLIMNTLPVVPPPIINGKPVRLAIAVPATREVDWRWSFAFSQMRMQFPSAVILADNKYGIATSREALVNQFNAIPDLTHMLFMDTDIIPPDYAIQTLLQDMATNDIHFVSGLYWNSLLTGNNAWIDERPLDIRQINAVNLNGNPLIKVDKFGMGFCIMDKELMKTLLIEDRPLFYYKVTDGALHSEDFYFQARLKRLGIPLFVDVRVLCSHIKEAVIGANFSINF